MEGWYIFCSICHAPKSRYQRSNEFIGVYAKGHPDSVRWSFWLL